MIQFPENTATADLVKAYNAGLVLLGKSDDDFLKKFRDKATAEKRLEQLQQDLLNMHGVAELTHNDEGFSWVIQKPKKTETESSPPSSPVTKTNLNLAGKIVVLSEGNPKRAGSRSYTTFSLYSTVATGEEYVAALVAQGFTRKLALSTLRWDIGHEYIRLED